MKTTTNRNKLEYSPPVLGELVPLQREENGCSGFDGEKLFGGGKTLELNNNKTQQFTTKTSPPPEGLGVGYSLNKTIQFDT